MGHGPTCPDLSSTPLVPSAVRNGAIAMMVIGLKSFVYGLATGADRSPAISSSTSCTGAVLHRAR